MEIHDPAFAGIREEGERILQLHVSGEHVRALQRAYDLALAHEDSPAAVILHAYLLREAARRMTRSDFKDRFNEEAEVAYGKAARMLPNCIDTGVSFGEVLSDLQLFDVAEAELTCALEISHPTDPLENNLAYNVSRPLRSSARTRIRDVRKRGWDAREENRACLVPNINSMIERVMAVRGSNVALKRAQGTASIYSFSIRAHLLHAHMSMEFAYSLPDRVRKSALQRVLPIIDNAEQQHKCDFQNSLVVSIFRAKMLYLLHDYAAAEQECRRGLRIQDADDPAQQDVPPGSVRGCDKHERIYSCRAQLSWLLVKLASESITFYLTSHEQHEELLSFTLASLMQQYCASNSAAAKMLLSAGKQFDRSNTWFSWICPCCKIKNLETPSALLKHIMRMHFDDLPQSDILQTVVEAFEGKASDEEDWPLDELIYDKATMRFSFQDIYSIVKLVTEAPPGNSFADILEKRRCEAAAIYEKIRQELQALPTECSIIQV
jgi:tetratricopeptide (TPR) repeat protein